MEDERVWLLYFGGVGLVVFIVGCIMGSRRRALSRAEVRTQGRVVKIEKSTEIEDGRTSVSYDRVVEFASSDGATHSFTDTMVGYGIGTTVNVVYDPENPSNARIPSVWNSVDLWLGIVLLWLCGFGVMVFSIAGFFLYPS